MLGGGLFDKSKLQCEMTIACRQSAISFFDTFHITHHHLGDTTPAVRGTETTHGLRMLFVSTRRQPNPCHPNARSTSRITCPIGPSPMNRCCPVTQGYGESHPSIMIHLSQATACTSAFKYPLSSAPRKRFPFPSESSRSSINTLLRPGLNRTRIP